MSKPEIQELAEKVASWAAPGEQVEAYVERRKSTSVRIYQGAIERFEQAEPYGVGIRVIADGRQGFASAGSLDETVLKETLEDARDNAGFAERDEFVGLADPSGAGPALELYYPDLGALSADDKIATAIELERRVLAADPRLRVRTAAWSDSEGDMAVATSTGISSWARSSRAAATISALADEHGQTQTGYGYDMARRPSDLDLDLVVDEAVEHTLRMLGAKKPASAKLTVVLTPEVSDEFLSVISATLSGDAVLKGRSLFADRVGQEVAASSISLIEDPTDVHSVLAWPTDDEGVPSRRVDLIKDGVLQGFLHNTYSGRRSGDGSTASAQRGYSTAPMVGARALTMAPGTKSQDELIAEVGEGVLIQGVTGLHSGVNPISGDFSVGANGLMIRGGALAEPVQEMTIASTIQRMLLDVVAVGGDLRWFGSSAGATLVIKDVALGGT